MTASKNLKMRIPRPVAANRGDVLRARGQADHQVHFRAHDDVIALFADGRIGLDRAIRKKTENRDRSNYDEINLSRFSNGFPNWLSA